MLEVFKPEILRKKEIIKKVMKKYNIVENNKKIWYTIKGNII